MRCSQQVGGLVRVVLPGDSSFSLVQSVFRDAKSGAVTAVRTPTFLEITLKSLWSLVSLPGTFS